MELEPNSNIFFDCGSSPVAVAAAADAPPLPKGLLLDPNADGAAPNTGAADVPDAAPNAGGADGAVAACPKIDPEALPAGAGDVVPKVLEPNVGVELVAFAVADPKLPNVGVLVDGLPKMGLAEAAGVAGEPKTGAALVAREELLLLAPNVNADGVDSAGFGVTVEAAAPPKLNPEEPVVAAALPKIELPVAEAAVEAGVAAEAAAPKVPNVGLSAPNVGTTLLVG